MPHKIPTGEKEATMNPIIGLTTYGRDELDIKTIHYDKHFALPTEYVDAVRRAGGIPVLLPPGEAHWDELLARLDGVIITGGSDVYPQEYGGDTAHPNLTKFDRERDASELTAIKKLVADGEKPVLGICRGMQTLNIALGGTLHEHIPDITTDIHRGADGGWAVQGVDTNANSALTQIMGSDHVETVSGHHQALKQLGENLEVVAQAPDGIIEAVAHTQHPWMMGVQWHPEVSAADDPSQQHIFDAFVQAAREFRQKRTQTS